MHINSHDGRKVKNKWRKRPFIIFLTLSCITLAIWAASASQFPLKAQTAVLSLNPSPATIQGCEIIQVDVNVADVIGLYGADVQLSFDPSILEVVDFDGYAGNGINVEAGSFLQNIWTVKNVADNSAGTIWYATTQLNPELPKSGSGTIMTIHFRAIGTGTSAITFTSSQFAGTGGVDIPVSNIDGSATTTPLASTTMSISRLNATTARLSWLSVVGADRYDLYRSTTNPYFIPTDPPYQSLSTATFDDIGVLGNTIDNFYSIKAACENGYSSDESTHVGEIDYPLNNSGGQYSMIAMPFTDTNITLASDLANHIGNVSALLKWEPSTQLFRFFVPPNLGDDFPITTGDAVYTIIANGGPNTTPMLGDVTSVQFPLISGGYNFISLPLNRSDLIDAQQTSADITHTNAMLSWNQNTQLFRFFAPPSFGDNFSLKIGDPFAASLDATGVPIWP